MVVKESSQASLANASSKRKASSASASGTSFADVMVGQSEEPRSKVSKKPASEGVPKAEKKSESAPKEISDAAETDAPEAELNDVVDDLEDELKKQQGQDANAYLMQLLFAAQQPQTTAETPVEATAEDAAVSLDVLEGVAPETAQTTDPNALLAQGEEMARMPIDGVPITDSAQQDAEMTLESGVNPSPLENVQKPADEETLLKTSGETDAQKAQNAQAAQNANGADAIIAPESTENADANAQSGQDANKTEASQTQETPDTLETTPFTPLNAFEPQNAPAANEAPAQPARLPQQLAQSAIAQTVEAIATGVKDGQRVVTLQMNPEFLGRMQMQLVLSEEGLTAKIRTSDPAVQSTLAAQISQLQAELEEKGIMIKEVEVLLASPEEQFFEQRQSASYQQQFRQGASGQTRTRYARYPDFEAQITQYAPGEELRGLENINGSVSFTA